MGTAPVGARHICNRRVAFLSMICNRGVADNERSRTCPAPPHPHPRRSTLVLAVLFAGAFVMGCAEMLVVGLIDLIAHDLSVSLAAAGALVTANALGLAIGGPVLTFLALGSTAGRCSRRDRSCSWPRNLLPAFGGDYVGVPRRASPDRRHAGTLHRRRHGHRDLDRAARARRSRDGARHLGLRDLERARPAPGHPARTGDWMARRLHRRGRPGRAHPGRRGGAAPVGALGTRPRSARPGPRRVRTPRARPARAVRGDLRGHPVGADLRRALPRPGHRGLRARP